MEKPWIALTAVLAGVGLLAVAAYVQINPLAFTTGNSSNSRVDLSPVEPAVAEVVREAVTQESDRAERGPSQTPTDQKSVSHGQQPPAREPRVLEPCSPWREIGPNYVTNGVGSGVRRVRELC